MNQVLANNPLTLKALHFVLRATVLMALSLVSPTWFLMKQILAPYFDFSVLQHLDMRAFIEVAGFSLRLNQDLAMAEAIILPMIGCFIVSLLFLWLAGKVSSRVADGLVTRLVAMPQPVV